VTIVQSAPAPYTSVGRRRDAIFLMVLALASVLSVAAFLAVYNNGHVLAYNDAISHQMIARRVVASNTPDAAQLGSVWLPLTHVLMLPLVVNDFMYYSGIAGALISMLSFVASVGFAYKILHRLTGSRAAGVVAATVFAVNANILYMQSTPMTELPLYASLFALVYFLQKWADDKRYQYLVAAAASAFASTLIRYESWPILLVLTVVVFITAFRERLHGISGKQRVGRTMDLMIAFGTLAFVGILFWGFWNRILFGSWTAFQGGDYAKPALWLTNSEPAIGDLALSIKTFYYATIENVPWPVLLAALIGLVAFFLIEVVNGKFHSRSLIVPSLLVIVPFFIIAIYKGQRPLHVLQTHNSLYNVRFGLIMVVLAALFAGYAVALFRKFKLVQIGMAALVAVLAIGTTVNDITTNHVVTLNDPVAALKEDRAVWAQDVINGYKPIYDADPGSGDVLIETFGNERLAFSTVPSDKMVYEGTNRDDRWKSALANPAAANIQWIVMRCIPGYRDRVCDALEGNPGALAPYDLVFTYTTGTQPAGYKIYKKVR
jgi:hypothetical protein